MNFISAFSDSHGLIQAGTVVVSSLDDAVQDMIAAHSGELDGAESHVPAPGTDGQVLTLVAGARAWAAAAGGVTDHGALTGLADDDHAQYVLLAGRDGGQTIFGGTLANGFLSLKSTSHATKGFVYAQNLFVAQSGFALMGVASPASFSTPQNNYAVSASVLRLTTSADTTISGIAMTAVWSSDGMIVVIHNIGAFTITLLDENAGSTSQYRFAFSSDVVLAPDESITLRYDVTSSRWRSIAKTSSAMTAAEILTAIKTVDGAGSGLDADMLDGLSSAAFAAAAHTHTLADITDDGTMAAQNASAVAITGGTINGATVGATTAAAGTFTTLQSTGNMTVDGDLLVSGNTVTINTATMEVEDPLIKLGKGNAADAVDVGFYGLYRPFATDLYAGMFRDATDGKFRLFVGLQAEPTTTVNTAGTGYAVATLVANVEGTATALATPRTINGTAFDGTANITVTAAGSTLSDAATIAKGGTGQTTAAAARVALLPAMAGNTLKVLRVNAGETDYEVATPAAGTPAAVAARVYNSANITLTTAVTTTLTFNTERYDTTAFHSTSTNTSRLTAPSTGYYHIGACVRFVASAIGVRTIAILLNGATNLAIIRLTPCASGTTHFTISCDYMLTAGDYVEVTALQDSGGNLDVVSAANSSPEFWIHLIGT